MTLRRDVETLPALLRRQASVRPDAAAFRSGGASLSYGELDEWSGAVARRLALDSFATGSRFAVVDKNRLEFFPVLYGGTRAGGIHVAINWRLTPAEMLHIVGESEPEHLFVGAELFAAIEAIEDELDGVRAIVALDEHPRWPTLPEWLDGRPGAEDVTGEAEVAGDDVAFLFYTSGTTGRPKGVPVSHAAAIQGARGLGPSYGFDDRSVSLLVMPTFHLAGALWSIQATYAGGANVVVRQFDPPAVLRTIEAEGVTHALLVPAMIQLLLEEAALSDVDLATLRTVSYGGSPIAPDTLARALAAFGCDFVQTYGLSETGGAVTTLEAGDHDPARPDLLASAGRPVPWVRVRIRDLEDGHELAPGEIGEVCVQSPTNTSGYWGRPEATAEAFRDGWLHTGDAGYVDDAGYLHLHDRVKDMIVTGGENVYPAEVEAVLVEHPDVLDVAVIGVPSDRWGEAVHAVAVRRPGASVSEAEIIERARARLAGFKLPKSMSFVDSLPRNPTGKVLKTELRAPYWSGSERSIH